LEVVAALLQELLVLSSILRLLRLLLEGASPDLGLRALQRRLLGSSAKAPKLLAKLLNSLPVSLLGSKTHALLLLGSLKRLLIALLIERGNGLRLRKPLLAPKGLPLQSSAVAAKSPGPNGFRLLLGKLLALLLAHSSLRSPYNALREGVHVLTNLKPLRVYRHCARNSSPRRRPIIGLGQLRGVACGFNASGLRRRQGGDKLAAVLLERLLCNIFGAGIDSIVPRQNFRRNRYCLGLC
jgi:hypothetical protein